MTVTKKIFALLLFLIPAAAWTQTAAITDFCILGAKQATTSGLNSSNYLQGIIPQCTVTVYLTGTTTLATIYSDSLQTPLTNPFTANTNGIWLFYATINQGYDVVLSGGISPNVYITPVTLTDVFISTRVPGVTSLNNLTGALSLTSTGGSVSITPLGSTINLEAVTATASSVTIGTTTVIGGTLGYILYDNAGELGSLGTTGTGNVVLSSTLNNYLPLTGGTLTGALSGTTAAFSGALSGGTVTFTNAVANQCVTTDVNGHLASTGVTCGTGASGGPVTSVGLTMPSIFSVSGTPITVAGTFAVTLTSETANTVFAAPNGSAGTPTFRALVAADVPTLNQSTTGNAATATTATNATNVATTTKSDNTPYYLTFVAANSSSNQGIDVGPMTYTPSTGLLTNLNRIVVVSDVTAGYLIANTQMQDIGLSTAGIVTNTASGVLGTVATTGTGTVVLSSALGSYLPLAGGTLTGPLFGTSASFSSSDALGGAVNGTNTAGGWGVEGSSDTGVGVEGFSTSGIGGRFSSIVDKALTTAGYVTNTASGALGSVATIPNSGLTNSSTTVNGQTCTLGSSCTISSGITVGSTSVSSGTSGYILYDNAGVLGNLATTGTGNVVRATSPTLVTPNIGAATGTSLKLNGGGGNSIDIGESFNAVAGMELGYRGGTAQSVYLDFHSSGGTEDYSSRIIADGGTSGTVGSGTLTFTDSNTIIGTVSTGVITESGNAKNSFTNLSTASGTYTPVADFLAPNQTTSGYVTQIRVGISASNYNMAYFGLGYISSGSTSNYLTLGLYGADRLVNIFGTGNVAIGTTTDSGYKLQISGTAHITGSISNSNGIILPSTVTGYTGTSSGKVVISSGTGYTGTCSVSSQTQVVDGIITTCT